MAACQAESKGSVVEEFAGRRLGIFAEAYTPTRSQARLAESSDVSNEAF